MAPLFQMFQVVKRIQKGDERDVDGNNSDKLTAKEVAVQDV